MPIALGELDLDEVLRYMGTPPSQAGPELRALVEECGRAVCAAARPRWAWRAFDIAEEEGGVRLSCGLLLPGQDLKRHLRGCGRAAVFCATLSAQVDALIRRWESGDIGRVSVESTGTLTTKVMAVKTGETTDEKKVTITAYLNSGTGDIGNASCEITVKPAVTPGISIDPPAVT